MLAPLADDADAPEPPPGLAASTLAHIAAHQAAHRLLKVPQPSRRQIGMFSRRGPRRADIVVAALILLLSRNGHDVAGASMARLSYPGLSE